MAYTYNFLSDIAIADVAFEVTGENLADILEGAAVATAAVMIDIDNLGTDETKTIELTEENEEDLLHSWLEELVYLKELEGIIFKDFDIEVKDTSGRLALNATARGEKIDQDRHDLGVDIKAVTYHMFQIWREGDSYHARVVLDI